MNKKDGILSRLFGKSSEPEDKAAHDGRAAAVLEIPRESAAEPGGDGDESATHFHTGYRIEVSSGPLAGASVELDRYVMVVGRAPGGPRKGWLVVQHADAPEELATLKWLAKERRFAIVHCRGAEPPTLVNGTRISDTEFTLLSHGDVIASGDVTLAVAGIAHGEAPPAAGRAGEMGRDETGDDGSDRTVAKKVKELHTVRVVAGFDEGSAFTISRDMVEDRLTIGRRGAVRRDIELNDETVSALHASLSFSGPWLCVSLEDPERELGVNGVPVLMRGLQEGDVVTIGATHLEYRYAGTPDRARHPFLEVVEGADRGALFPVMKRLVRIGRRSGDDEEEREILLSRKDRSISRCHAFLERRDESYWLVNEKPDNQTFVNGILVNRPTRLIDGDRIRLGDTALLHYSQPAPPCRELPAPS